MGIAYLLKKGELIFDGLVPESFIIKNPLSEKEADELLEIQKQISKEISEPIHLLTKTGLTEKSLFQADDLIYCLSKNDKDECIGYGYGYADRKEKAIFYIDTIGVHSDYRGKGIGTKIKIRLINKVFENSKFESIKAITQNDNGATIKINRKLGFKLL